jgi:anti-sigma B factor antagonist
MEPDNILTVTGQDLPGGSTVLTPVGEIDRDSSAALREAAGEAVRRGRRKLILDLTKLTFCDSSGLSLFVDLHRQAGANGGWLRMVSPQANVRSMLRITHLDQLFALYDTVEAAAES